MSEKKRPGVEQGTREEPLPMGATAKIGDWELTILSVERDAVAMETSGAWRERPAEGMTYSYARVRATYRGRGKSWLPNDVSAAFVGSDARRYEFGHAKSNSIEDEPTVYTGGTVEGNWFVELPRAVAADALVVCSPDVHSAEEVWWDPDAKKSSKERRHELLFD